MRRLRTGAHDLLLQTRHDSLVNTPLPETITQVRCAGQGEPRLVARLERVPCPRPGASEVLIAMLAAPVHNIDLYRMRGRWRHRSLTGDVPGYEGVGRIIAVGEAVTGLKVGDLVFPPMGAGTWREVLCVPAAQVRAAPAGDPAQLALLGINPPSAWLLLHAMTPLQPGDWFIHNAANSSCGQYLVTLAREAGFRSISIVRRDSAGTALRERGGDVVLVDGPELAARVAAATGNAQIPLAIDAVNGAATQRLADCLAPGGLLVVYGMLSGDPCEIRADDLFVRDIRLQGFLTTRTLAGMATQDIAAMNQALAALVTAGTLAADIAAEYPLAAIHAALAHAGRQAEARTGKVILRMDTPAD